MLELSEPASARGAKADRRASSGAIDAHRLPRATRDELSMAAQPSRRGWVVRGWSAVSVGHRQGEDFKAQPESPTEIGQGLEREVLPTSHDAAHPRIADAQALGERVLGNALRTGNSAQLLDHFGVEQFMLVLASLVQRYECKRLLGSLSSRGRPLPRA